MRAVDADDPDAVGLGPQLDLLLLVLEEDVLRRLVPVEVVLVAVVEALLGGRRGLFPRGLRLVQVVERRERLGLRSLGRLLVDRVEVGLGLGLGLRVRARRRGLLLLALLALLLALLDRKSVV